MEIHSFNAELALANLMFSQIFRNIKIRRTNDTGDIAEFDVPCVFGQRSRIIKSMENDSRQGKVKFPMITINRTGYTRNADRLNNLHNEVRFEITSKNRSYDLLTPIPIDISYDVSITAKLPSDIDYIASNFMVFFNNDIFVNCMHPKYDGIQLKNQIIMSDSVSEEHPDELDASADDLITTTFQFTFKTYLFGGNKQVDGDVYEGFVPTINGINIGFYPIAKISSDFEKAMQNIDEMYSDETIYISSYISTDLSGNDYYEKTTLSCESFPYVDRFIWKIDGASTADFPNNANWIRANLPQQ